MLMSVMVSSGILDALQLLSRLSSSTSISLGSKRSNTAFFGPSESVFITYVGGAQSRSHITTVFFTLNSGRSCSSDKAHSFLSWVLFWVRRVSIRFKREWNTIDGKQL